jgi:hypothetical protein
MFLGAKERVAGRLVASRLPESIVKERRRLAKKQAKHKGATPSKAPRALCAWHLLSPKGPPTLWRTATRRQGYPRRWPGALLCPSWTSSLHFAAIKTKKVKPTWCDLDGRRLLVVRNDALCPQWRAT